MYTRRTYILNKTPVRLNVQFTYTLKHHLYYQLKQLHVKHKAPPPLCTFKKCTFYIFKKKRRHNFRLHLVHLLLPFFVYKKGKKRKSTIHKGFRFQKVSGSGTQSFRSRNAKFHFKKIYEIFCCIFFKDMIL